ncbi:acyl-CoA thioesterase [Aestuariibacter sp. AA17]|uniref:Acyl-CoA thioesterase n=1 Tax=Fluctibacter corallii TaxID=2984329 RepID=A0ABT3A331_9ALTE|nr:acyl-CoA thioesterase [Aestuariibacter sp. AA17]MCV2883090.1 acyl-CoA thioesterase [Aestuariibacter sp. AA17]
MPWTVTEPEIDHYQHVNNAEYVKQLERVAWSHSNSLGLTLEMYRECDRAMAIRRHEIDYLASAYLGDELLCATWIVTCDKKLKLTRQFQIIRKTDGLTILKASTQFVCIAMSTGKPKKMPTLFADIYGKAVTPDLALTETT